MGLVRLRLMEGSPTSPTTLEGGTSGTNQADTSVDQVLLQSTSYYVRTGRQPCELYIR